MMMATNIGRRIAALLALTVAGNVFVLVSAVVNVAVCVTGRRVRRDIMVVSCIAVMLRMIGQRGRMAVMVFRSGVSSRWVRPMVAMAFMAAVAVPAAP